MKPRIPDPQMERLLERRARQRQADARYSEKRKAKRKQPLVDDRPDGVVPGLSSRRTRELAEWYAGQADKRSNVPPSPAIYGQTPRRVYGVHHSPNALAAGALDAELRAILQREAPELVEIEFERIMRLVRRG